MAFFNFSTKYLVDNKLGFPYKITRYGGSVTTLPPLPVYELTSDYKSSVSTPNFRNLKKRDLPVNDFQVQRELKVKGNAVLIDGPNGAGQFQTETGHVDYLFGTSGLVGGLVHVSAAIAQSDNMATSRMLTKLSNQKVNIAQSFAERTQTANLLINSVNRLATFALHFRRGNFTAARRMLEQKQAFFTGKRFPPDSGLLDRKTFANLWLEYSYGWRPLVGDIYGSAQLLAEQILETRPTTIRTKGRIEEEVSSIFGSSLKHSLKRKVISTSHLKIMYDMDDLMKATLASTGISNPALLVWELLPYSFVVDWVFPVGTYLKQVQASDGLQFISGSLTSVGIMDSSAKIISGPHHRQIGSASAISGIMRRSKLLSFPTAKPPRLNWNLNLSQVTSSLSLLQQVFTGTPRVSRGKAVTKVHHSDTRFDFSSKGRSDKDVSRSVQDIVRNYNNPRSSSPNAKSHWPSDFFT